MSLTTTIELTYEEAQALFTTVRFGMYYVQDHLEGRRALELRENFRMQGETAFRVSRRVLQGLCDEFLKDTDRWEGEVDGAFLCDSYD
jgi:hypothetical protein